MVNKSQLKADRGYKFLGFVTTKPGWNYEKNLTKNKVLHISALFEKNWTNFWFLQTFLNRKENYAGISIIIHIVWFQFHFAIVDNRHWNNEENRWYEHGEVTSEDTEEILSILEELANNANREEILKTIRNNASSDYIYGFDEREGRLYRMDKDGIAVYGTFDGRTFVPDKENE